MSNTVLPQIPSASVSRTISGTSASTNGPSASSAPTQQQDSGNNQVSFYRNLFYILIALLGVFAILSVLSLLRARRRRKILRAEAERLGVLIPGMDGYVPLRERQALKGTPGGGVPTPKWWEIGSSRWMNEKFSNQSNNQQGRPDLLRGYSSIEKSQLGGLSALSSSSNNDYQSEKQLLNLDESPPLNLIDFKPLAIIPPTSSSSSTSNPSGKPSSSSSPFIRSDIKYFPSHLAYRPSDLLPPPLIWEGDGGLNQIDGLRGGKIDMVTMIRMPEPESTSRIDTRPKRDDDDEDGQEVLREWGGVCLGVVSLGIEGGQQEIAAATRNSTGGDSIGSGQGDRNGKARDAW